MPTLDAPSVIILGAALARIILRAAGPNPAFPP